MSIYVADTCTRKFFSFHFLLFFPYFPCLWNSNNVFSHKKGGKKFYYNNYNNDREGEREREKVTPKELGIAFLLKQRMRGCVGNKWFLHVFTIFQRYTDENNRKKGI